MKKALYISLLCLLLAGLLNAVPRKYCAVEAAVSVGCGPCKGAVLGGGDLVTNGHPVAVVNYFYSPYDNSYSSARRSYYVISGTPTVLFDGLNRYVGGGSTSLYTNYLPRVNARLAIPAHYTISACGSAVGNQYAVNVTVTKAEADTNSMVVLHASVTESNVYGQAWGSYMYLPYINRLMVPSASGTSVSLATGQQTVIPLSFTLNTAYAPHNCEIVLWLQNVRTKEILQCDKYPFDYLFKDFAASPTEGTAPLTVQFQNYAQTYGLAAHWDFENDGVYDYTGNNPQHLYTEPGVYSVKYKVTFGADADSLLKTDYITVLPPVVPLAPQNVYLSRSGNLMQLAWDPVTQDAAGNPLVPDHYQVLYSADPYAEIGLWTQLGTTTGLSYEEDVFSLAATRRYYLIRAVTQ